jgi:hypothetical protein
MCFLFYIDIWMYLFNFTQYIVLKRVHIIQKVQDMNSVQYIGGKLSGMIDAKGKFYDKRYVCQQVSILLLTRGCTIQDTGC